VAGRKAKVKDNPVGTHSAQCRLFLARDSAAPLKKCLHILSKSRMEAKFQGLGHNRAAKTSPGGALNESSGRSLKND